MDGSLRTRVVLVIDDDEFSRKSIVRALAKLGAATIFEAASGDEAMERHRADAGIDLIVSDLGAPEVDGIETLRRVAETHHGADIILTGGAEGRTQRSFQGMASALGLPSLWAVPKPITTVKLREALAQLATAREQAAQDGSASLVTADEIRRGLAAGEFIAHFQPKVAIATRTVGGAEALVRWRHPIYGLLSPAVFLALAFKAGHFDALTDTVLATAIAQCAAWKRAGLDIGVSVNLPVACLASPELPNRIGALIDAHGLARERLTLEVTADGWLHPNTQARAVLARLRLSGYRLAIDDYGTGYATAHQLLDAPFSEMKIDQSFLSHAFRDEDMTIVLASVIDMAHRLKLDVVAKGVETAAHWELLGSLSCDMAQGYFVAKPMPGDQLIEWMSDWGRTRPL